MTVLTLFESPWFLEEEVWTLCKDFPLSVLNLLSRTNTCSDPLFQYALVQVVRNNPQIFSASTPATSPSDTWTSLPIIFDETFSGAYRLGRPSSASLIQASPDIVINAGNDGTSQCTISTTKEIYKSFDGKLDSLPESGASSTVLSELAKKDAAGVWDKCKENWSQETTVGDGNQGTSNGLWSLWDRGFLQQVSLSPDVRNVMALGSVLVVTLHSEDTGTHISILTSERELVSLTKVIAIGSWHPKTPTGLQKRVQLADPKEEYFQTKIVGEKSFYIVAGLAAKTKQYISAQKTILDALFPKEAKS